jgi:hypothetical protein
VHRLSLRVGEIEASFGDAGLFKAGEQLAGVLNPDWRALRFGMTTADSLAEGAAVVKGLQRPYSRLATAQSRRGRAPAVTPQPSKLGSTADASRGFAVAEDAPACVREARAA